MASSSASSAIDLEVARVRALSRSHRYGEALAAAEALEEAAPHDRQVVYLIAANQRCLNRVAEALTTLQRLEQRHPEFSLLYQERGHCYTALRDAPRAIDAFRRGVALNPALAVSWSMLERLYRITGDGQSAEVAAQHVATLGRLPSAIVQAGSLFSDGELSAAENILRSYLATAGEHVEAVRLLGRIARQRGAFDEAERLLEAAVALAPDYRAARLDHARTLVDRQKYPQAHRAIDVLLKLDPRNAEYLSLYAAAWVGLGRHEPAMAVYRELLDGSPASPELHVALGHSLQSVGHRQDAIRSYQTAAALRPSFGDAYWSLANLKTYRFSPEEIARMRAQETAPAAHSVDRYHLCFALGRAYEDRGEYAASWQFYERGNSLKRAEINYRPEIAETNARRQIETWTGALLTAHAGAGAPDIDPIFIVGLPRSGSTLLEQILASHSQVEGTQELAEIPRIALDVRAAPSDRGDPSPLGALAALAGDDFRRLGERYLTETRAYRGEKPFFIDKMPNNFRHLGLLHLMLPNARIIDARREPMACCFSNLKQLFASGQEFAYSMEDIGRYYRTYLDLMRHWDSVLPGRILRVRHEDVVEDLEGSARRILEFCGLAFEPACVEFHKTVRSVRTASSDQVRQPISREGLFQWRNYERWLGPLYESLGDALIHFRD